MSVGNNHQNPDVPDWCEIAERASKESDPKKLIQLVRALCDRLQQSEQRKKQARIEVPSRSDGTIVKPPAA
jgi:hypothetical protein